MYKARALLRRARHLGLLVRQHRLSEAKPLFPLMGAETAGLRRRSNEGGITKAACLHIAQHGHAKRNSMISFLSFFQFNDTRRSAKHTAALAFVSHSAAHDDTFL
jgi:hypothetical protein